MSILPLRVKAVLFDLDGTLVDSAPDLARAVNNMLKELGRAEQPLAQIIDWVGNGMPRLVKRVLTSEMGGEPEPSLFEQALALFKKHYAANLVVHTRPFPGTIETLEQLSARGYALACVTNKAERFTLPLLAQLDLAKYFGLVVAGDTVPALKPDPAPLQYACRHFDIPPAQATLIGDSANDVMAARAAGMPAIAVTYGYNHGQDVRELNPDLVVDSLAEVPQYLRLWTA
ncbi:MAG: phosphoglycolate phosphatase [Gammaproteobacteria bacterium]|nr:phosphoglycolate phosphatase [Gammaproteobacteria bacterium]